MHAFGVFFGLNVLLMLVSVIILIASTYTRLSSKPLHMIYFTAVILVIGVSTIVSIIMFGFGGFDGIEDVLITVGPTVMTVLLLIAPLLKSLKSDKEYGA